MSPEKALRSSSTWKTCAWIEHVPWEAPVKLRSRRWLFLLLALWLAGILFPAALPGKSWTAYRAVFDAVFHPQWVHVVMHLALFGSLSVLFALLFRLRAGWRTLGLLLAATVMVGIGQEILQALSQGFFYFGGAVFDLGIDLLGAGAGYLLLVGYHNFWDNTTGLSKK